MSLLLSAAFAIRSEFEADDRSSRTMACIWTGPPDSQVQLRYPVTVHGASEEEQFQQCLHTCRADKFEKGITKPFQDAIKSDFIAAHENRCQCSRDQDGEQRFYSYVAGNSRSCNPTMCWDVYIKLFSVGKASNSSRLDSVDGFSTSCQACENREECFSLSLPNLMRSSEEWAAMQQKAAEGDNNAKAEQEFLNKFKPKFDLVSSTYSSESEDDAPSDHFNAPSYQIPHRHVPRNGNPALDYVPIGNPVFGNPGEAAINAPLVPDEALASDSDSSGSSRGGSMNLTNSTDTWTDPGAICTSFRESQTNLLWRHWKHQDSTCGWTRVVWGTSSDKFPKFTIEQMRCYAENRELAKSGQLGKCYLPRRKRCNPYMGRNGGCRPGTECKEIEIRGYISITWEYYCRDE